MFMDLFYDHDLIVAKQKDFRESLFKHKHLGSP